MKAPARGMSQWRRLELMAEALRRGLVPGTHPEQLAALSRDGLLSLLRSPGREAAS